MIYSIVLSGGEGKRLKPLSQKEYPKQFIKIFNSMSLFQKGIMRNISFSTPVIVTNSCYYNIVQEQLMEIIDQTSLIILEKNKLGTALAIANAANILKSDDIMIITPADLYIDKNDIYYHNIQNIIDYIMHTNKLVILAVKAKEYNCGYGYMKLNYSNDIFYDIIEFYEKPSHIEYEQYYWNTGIFICRASNYLSLLKRYNLYLFNKAAKLFNSAVYENGIYMLQECCISGEISVDTVIMEKVKDAVAIICEYNWCDLGSWISVYNYLFQCRNKSNIYVCNGIINKEIIIKEVIKNKLIIVMVNGQICFICYEVLNCKNNEYINKHWGKYRVLYHIKNKFLIKHLVINMKQAISLQKHQYRSEDWLIISGKGHMVVNEKHKVAEPGSVFHIPREHVHKIINISNNQSLHIIEVQRGSFLSENDIIRI